MRRPVALLAAVLLTLGLAGCGGDDDAGPAAPSSSSTAAETTPDRTTETTETGGDTPSQPADALVIEITIAGGEVEPAGQSLEAKVGQPIELRVDSDAEDELHVHSTPEHEFEVKARDGQVFTFTVDQPGQVEIETHETGVVIAELSVTP